MPPYRRGFTTVAPCRPNHLIDVIDAGDGHQGQGLELEVENVGAGAVELVLMAFERVVEEHVAGLSPIAAAVAGFDVAAAKNDGGIRIEMAMAADVTG